MCPAIINRYGNMFNGGVLHKLFVFSQEEVVQLAPNWIKKRKKRSEDYAGAH
jgi:hypothetical protein